MDLTHKQKKYLRKNLKRFPLTKISAEINVSEKEIIDFLRKHWPKEKFQNFFSQQKREAEKIKISPDLGKNFSFLKWFRQNWLAIVFLALLVGLTYFNSLRNDFVSDDISGIRENQNLGNFSSLFSNPLTFLRNLFYFLVFKIWGLEPIFFRLINIFFHLGSVWLVYLLIALMSNPTVAFLTAAIFAVHPILSEAVTWISGGPYPQYTFFILASFILYLLGINKNSLKIYLFSLFAFFLAIFSTEKALIFPFIILLFEFSSNSISKNWRKVVPFFLLASSWFFIFFSQGALTGRVTTLQTEYYQKPGLENPLIQIPVALSSYLELIFWPKNLTLYHSEMMFTQINYFIRVLVALGLFAAIIFSFRKNKTIFFWLSFFLITLLPTLTPLKISWIVAERYVYLGTLGVFVLIALAIQKIGEISKNTKISYLIFGLVLALLAIRTIIRNSDWKNQDTLWLATARTSPSSAQNHNNLGDYYTRNGNLEKAAEEFKIAIQLQSNYGDALHNLANIYQQMGKTELAIENYQMAIGTNPNLWQSHQNLAAIYFGQGKFDLAEENIQKAIQIIPQNPNLYLNLGVIYLQKKDKQKAKEAFQKVLELDPQNQNAKQLLISIEKE